MLRGCPVYMGTADTTKRSKELMPSCTMTLIVPARELCALRPITCLLATG